MRKVYDDEFKRLIIRLSVKEKMPREQIKRDYGVNIKTFEKWITRYYKDNDAYDVDKERAEEKVKRLEKRIRELERVNGVLKKTLEVWGEKEGLKF